MAGMEVIVVACDDTATSTWTTCAPRPSSTDANLAALMVTYPSTHGVFEEGIVDICAIIHEHGGQVYMDGANMNAQVGLTSPGRHRRRCLPPEPAQDLLHPHGGGGPGMGPICVASTWRPICRASRWWPGVGGAGVGGQRLRGAVGQRQHPAHLLRLHRHDGRRGLTDATEIAILNANYVARRLEPHYPVLYKGANGRVAHECIIDRARSRSTASRRRTSPSG
jgi:glycine dehydrogenase